ncbi:MAG: hypothetical protein ABII23_00885, partial [bacterium]
LPDQLPTLGYYDGAINTPKTYTAGNTMDDFDLYSIDISYNNIVPEVQIPVSFIEIPGLQVDLPTGQFIDGTGQGTVSGILVRTASTQMYLHAVADTQEWGVSEYFVVEPAPYEQVILIADGQTLIPGGEWRDPDGDGTDELVGRVGSPGSKRVHEVFDIHGYLVDQYFNPVNQPPTGWPVVELLLDGSVIRTMAPSGPDVEFADVEFTTLGSHELMMRQQTDNSIFNIVTIEATSGDVESFTIENVSNKNAGDPMLVTITAWDNYGYVAETFTGDVTLELFSNGTLVDYDGPISPQTVTFDAADQGIKDVSVTVYYAGESLGLGPDNLTIEASVIIGEKKNGFSDPFDIYEKTYAGIILMLPGDVHHPGIPSIMPGQPNMPLIKLDKGHSVTAGASILSNIYAIDEYGNRFDTQGNPQYQIVLSLADGQANVDFDLITPGMDAAGTVVLGTDGFAQREFKIYTAKAIHTVNAIGLGNYSDSSDITVNIGPYNDNGKLLLIVAGETILPGWPIGKTGNPNPVQAYTVMSSTIYACDQFYNIDTGFNGQDVVQLNSNDNAINVSDIDFNQGKAVVSDLFLRGGQGFEITTLIAADQTLPARNSSSLVPVEPGAFFVINVPSEIAVGEEFPLVVELMEPTVPPTPGNFNHEIYFEAVKSDLSPATAVLDSSFTVLINGVGTENQQRYFHPETIRIKVTDQFNRIRYSSDIKVVPNGLIYQVDCPANDPVSVDDEFTMTVSLFDSIYPYHVITTMDHYTNISVVNGGGIVGIAGQQLVEGIATITNQSYTKSETVNFKAAGTVTVDQNIYSPIGYSENMTFVPGAYSRVQIIAPGEIPLRGTDSPQGKDSSNTEEMTQTARQGFNVTVYAVDMYWNIVNSIGSQGAEREIKLTASDGSLIDYPTNSFINGKRVMENVQLFFPPVVTVTAEDVTNGSNGINSDASTIPVVGYSFTIIVQPNWPPDNQDQYVTGKNLNILVKVWEYSTGEDGDIEKVEIVTVTPFHLIPLNNNFEPLDPNNIKSLWSGRDPLDPNRFVADAPSTGGGTEFVIQYMVAEDVIFQAVGADGWVGYSVDEEDNTKIIHFEPERVEYQLMMPDEGIVGPPDTFTMTVSAIDVNTDTIPENYSSAFTIQVANVANAANQHDGILLVTQREIAGGSVSFEQAFTRAGIISFKVVDVYDSGMSAESSILLHAGALAECQDDIPEIMEAGTEKEVRLAFFDQYSNPIKDVQSVLSLDDDLKSYQLGKLNTFSVMSNSLGVSTARLSVLEGFSGHLFFAAMFGGQLINKVIKVVGPPETNLTFGGLSHDTFKGHSVKTTDPIILAAEYDGDILSLDRIMYRVDDGQWQEYLGAFNITEVGVHTIEYYGVTVGELEHPEAAKKSLTVYVTALTAESEGLVNYPNPFQAGKEATALEFYHNLDSSMKLLVFDLMGQKVYEQDYAAGEILRDANGINKILWDGRNSDGRVVANGGYVVYIKINDAGRTVKRKIAVRK